MIVKPKWSFLIDYPWLLQVTIAWGLARICAVAGVGLLIYCFLYSEPTDAAPFIAALVCGAVTLTMDALVGAIGGREVNHIFDLFESAKRAHSETEVAIAEATLAKAKMEELFASATAAKAQTDELFAMADMLQSAEGYEDATAVLSATSRRLLPDVGASLYVFNNSRDRLDLAGSWNMPEGFHQADTLAPINCWSLKRGKPHLNDADRGSLCCDHHASSVVALEIPMVARGSVHGLLTFASDKDDAAEQLAGLSRVGQALADSMSLALSNISLREKLRTQSLRDPLTGLYNRRYMEDALERYINLAERTGGSTAVLMIDLDNFKQLNDEHGHAKGDAVLRDVAAQLVGGLRPSDVPCRYGGEELMVILPNCSLEDAQLRAEALRLRIESLGQAHQVSVSASFGVASIPETSATLADLVPMADAALYRAKSKGKNIVECSSRRAGKEDAQPRLVRP